MLRKTIRMMGKYKNRELIILIDSDSTHSFLDMTVARKLKLSSTPATAISVTVADGRKVACNSICEGFSWKIQQHEFSFDLKVLELGTFHMILGVDWMKGFNSVMFDFESSRVIFSKDGRILILQGLTDSVKPSLQACDSFQKLM